MFSADPKKRCILATVVRLQVVPRPLHAPPKDKKGERNYAEMETI